MKLTIRTVGMSDYGTYKCISKNSLGETDGSIKLYHIPTPTTEPRTTSTTPLPTVDSVENIQGYRQKPMPSLEPSLNEITDASLSTIVRSEETVFHGKSSSGGYVEAENTIETHERKSMNDDVRPRRIDNTAQSMSSRGDRPDFCASSRVAICIILLSSLS
ncbi:hypothetical protein KM043_018339 [Ampulex compressa]|nr:hypothetical protein KM043_018339 [Ampulex compressa]